MRMEVPSLALLSGSGIWRCGELWCRLQMRLRSGVVVAGVEAGSYSSDSTPSLGTSLCHVCGPKTQKEKKKGNSTGPYLGIGKGISYSAGPY